MEQTVQQLEAGRHVQELSIDDVSNQEVEAVYQSGDLPGVTRYNGVEDVQKAMFEAGAGAVRLRRSVWKNLAQRHGSSFEFPNAIPLTKVNSVLHYLTFLALPDVVIDGLVLSDNVKSFNIVDKDVQLIDEGGNALVTIPAIKLMTQPSVIMEFLMGPDGITAVAECIAANQPPVDYLQQEVDGLVEATATDERMEAAISEDPTMDVVKSLDLLDANSDYMKFEEYLDIMRKLHLYDDMAADMRVSFDQSIVYRWRDIKALKDLLARVELNPKSNALTRHMAELRSLGDRLDSAYLEIRHLRAVLEHEASTLEEEAKKLKKKGNLTTAGILIRSSNRLYQQRNLLGPLPAEAVDVVTRLYSAYNEERRQRQLLVRGLALECKKRLDDLKEGEHSEEYQQTVRDFVQDVMNSMSSALDPQARVPEAQEQTEDESPAPEEAPATIGTDELPEMPLSQISG